MTTITISREQTLAAIKPITRASCSDWGQQFKALATAVVPVIAIAVATTGYTKQFIRRPKATLLAIWRGIQELDQQWAASKGASKPSAEATPMAITQETVKAPSEATQAPKKRRTRKAVTKKITNNQTSNASN